MILLNNQIVPIKKFPNNEIRIQNITKTEKDAFIELKYESSDDLIALWFIKSKLDELYVKTNLYIRYMPYSRMDREIEPDLFLLRYICKYINLLNFSNVYVLEPHSIVTEELLRNVIPIYPMNDLILQVKNKLKTELLQIVFPDHGSFLRYGKDAQDYLLFEKSRDSSSTKIKTLQLKEGIVKKNGVCLIIDDLCATGNTCNLVGKILKEKQAENVYVLCVHTENQCLEQDVIKNSFIDGIFTTSSLLTKKHEKITVLDFNFDQYLV